RAVVGMAERCELAPRRQEPHHDRLLEVVAAARQLEVDDRARALRDSDQRPVLADDVHGAELCAEELELDVGEQLRVVCHGQPPIRAVPTATTCPTGRSAGSLQVSAMSPLRAAPLPLMSTVALPSWIVALFDGGFWNGPPWGTWDGVFVAVEPTTAAGWPPMLTSDESAPSSCPVNGCGSGVGTGPPG